MLIPPEAKRVFSGVIFDVYQWEQALYDGTTATFERLKRPDTVVILAQTVDGLYLTMQEEQPGKGSFASVPGGRVDPGETPLVAARRELLEETGYTSEEWEEYFSVQPVSKIDWSVHYFFARNCTKTAEQSLDSGEKIIVSTVDAQTLKTLLINGDIRDPELTLRALKGTLLL